MKQLLEELKSAVLNEDFYEMNLVIEKIKKEDNPFIYIKPMITLMEENPNIDFGNPGPMVHFMETYYKKGYEELLLASVNRNPTMHTVWMINRIINDPNLKDKQKYLNVLKMQLYKKNVGNDIKSLIKSYLIHQKND